MHITVEELEKLVSTSDLATLKSWCDGGLGVLACCWVHERLDLFSAALKNGANPNEYEQDGAAILNWAVGSGDMAVMRELIRYGANAEGITWSEETPLETAVRYGNIEAARLLLELGADPSVRREESAPSPLAAAAGNSEMRELLLSYGATLESKVVWEDNREE